MKLLLKREHCGPCTTLSSLFIDGKFECFTLEDKDRQLECNPDDKIAGETAIPRGTYQVLITYSNRFKCEMPLLVDVPGFEGVRIHPGNTKEDTHGCLLVGTSFVLQGEQHIVNNSRNAYNRLFPKIDDAINRGESVEIEIA